MIDVKYFAGLIDSDGSILIRASKLADGTFTVLPVVSLKQLSFRDKPLQELAEHFDVGLHKEHPNPKWGEVSSVILVGKKALRLLEQVNRHLVLKKDVADFVQAVAYTNVCQERLSSHRGTLKYIRNSKSHWIKNYPSRRWMAGYVDGDGSLSAQRCGDGVSVRLNVTTYIHDVEGVELLQKAFGGRIRSHGKNAKRWELCITESNCNKVLGHFAKHSQIKREQVYHVMGFISSGKHLKTKGATPEGSDAFIKTLREMKTTASTKREDA